MYWANPECYFDKIRCEEDWSNIDKATTKKVELCNRLRKVAETIEGVNMNVAAWELLYIEEDDVRPT